MVQSLKPEYFLNKHNIERLFIKNMEPALHFNGILPVTDIDSSDFTYIEDDLTATKDITDGVQGEPMPAGEMSQLTEISISDVSQKVGKIYKMGYKIKFSRDVLRRQDIIDEFQRTYHNVGFGIAYKINGMLINGLTGGAGAGKATIPVTWGSDTGKQNPLEDIIKSSFAYKLPTKPRRLTGIYLNETNYEELLIWCYDNDHKWERDPTGATVLQVPQMLGMSFFDVDDQISEGYWLGMDIRPQIYPGATVYRSIDPKFSSAGANQKNPQEGATRDQTVINVNVKEQDEYPFITVIDVWTEMGLAIKDSTGIQYQNGV